jgi:hypothetical protein
MLLEEQGQSCDFPVGNDRGAFPRHRGFGCSIETSERVNGFLPQLPCRNHSGEQYEDPFFEFNTDVNWLTG